MELYPIPGAIIWSVATVGIAIIAMGLFGGKNRMPVDGKTVLITGASEGMGEAAARQLAAKGANVILVARDVGKLEQALENVKAAAKNPATQKFTYFSTDVSTPDFAEPLLASCLAWNGGRAPDIVWCCVGFSHPSLFVEESAQSLRRHMDINYHGSALLAHAVMRAWQGRLPVAAADGGAAEATSGAEDRQQVPEIRGGGQGKRPAAVDAKHIIFTSSSVAFYNVVGYSAYGPAKAALRSLADALVQEVMLYPPERPVDVHIVFPGTIRSPGYERESLVKPQITKSLEEDDPVQEADEVAAQSIRSLEKGHYLIVTNWLAHLMRWGSISGSPKNNVVVDAVMGIVLVLAWLIAQPILLAKIRKYAREERPFSGQGRKLT